MHTNSCSLFLKYCRAILSASILLALINKGYSEDLVTIDEKEIGKAIIVVMMKAHGADDKNSELQAYFSKYAAMSAGKFQYIRGKFPKEMMEKFISFHREIELRGDNKNLVLEYYDENLVRGLSDNELAALFHIIKQGFPVQTIEVELEEK